MSIFRIHLYGNKKA
ncbi:hypothetical protein [Escherichia coli]